MKILYLFIGCMILFSSNFSLAKEEIIKKNIFMNYTKEELDHNYDQAAWAPNINQILSRYDFKSDKTLVRLGEPEKYLTGKGNVEGITFYRAKNKSSPIQVFIHGGAWRAGRASSYIYPAEMFLDSGISYAALDFNNVQDVGLDGMLEEIISSISWIYENADKLGIDRERIYISGHSSGAHLAGVILTTDWEKYDLPSNIIKGATLLSGMYDLESVRLSNRSNYIHFTDELENSMSTQRHLDKIKSDVILAYGGFETHEFQRQTTEFYKAMKNSGKKVDLIKFDYSNHFEILENFDNPYDPVSKKTLEMIGIN